MITRENWLTPPLNRQSFQQIQSLFETTPLARGNMAVSPLPYDPMPIDHITYAALDGSTRTIAQMLSDNFTDAFLVVKNGTLICEHYENGMQPSTPHLLNSISKTFLGMLAGIGVAEGTLDPSEKLTTYVPEFAGSAFVDTTLQQALDMTGAVKYGEDYANAAEDFWVETATVGWRPDLAETASTGSLMDFAQSQTETEQADGEAFHYRTILTNVVAMAIEAGAQQSVAQLMQDRIWQHLGVEHDASVVVDGAGFPYFGAGMSATARDLARFGQVLLNDGVHQGVQVIPKEWIERTRAGSATHREHFAKTEYAALLPNGHYQNQTWASADDGVLVCIGIFGQIIYTDQKADVVIVKLSTHPEPVNDLLYADAFFAMKSLAKTLGAEDAIEARASG